MRLYPLTGVMLLAVGALHAAPVNVALAANGGVASQSSTYDFTTVASKCNDGNTDGNYFTGNICATNQDANAFWEVTFAADYTVVSIDIFNRADCCDTRINPFTLFLYDDAHSQVWTSGPGQTMGSFLSFPVPGIFARTARVQLDTTNNLNLGEVEVMANTGAPEPGTFVLALAAIGAASVVCGRRRS